MNGMCRFWSRRRGVDAVRKARQGTQEARAKALASQESVERAQARWEPVNIESGQITIHLERNHLAERLEAAMRPRRPQHP